MVQIIHAIIIGIITIVGVVRLTCLSLVVDMDWHLNNANIDSDLLTFSCLCR